MEGVVCSVDFMTGTGVEFAWRGRGRPGDGAPLIEGNGRCGILLLGGELMLGVWAFDGGVSTWTTVTDGFAVDQVVSESSGKAIVGIAGSSGVEIVGMGGFGVPLTSIEGRGRPEFADVEVRDENGVHLGTSSTLIFGMRLFDGDSSETL